jgi:uncharacterized membrane protein YdjX (TVP38/TMEM64 family)
MLRLFAGVEQYGAAAPIVFVVLYAISVVAFVPVSPLTLLGGAIFGVWRGVLFSFCGAVIGSTAAFLIGRHAARRFVERRVAAMPRMAAIDRAVAAQGRRIVFLLRLSPLVPFNVLNYALGVSRVSVRDFIVASVGMLPGGLMYAYVGSVAGQALALAAQARAPRDASYYAMLIVGLAATLGVSIVLSRAARMALRDV